MTKISHFINFLLQCLVASMIIVSLSLNTWFSYCYFDWGLTVIDSNNTDFTDKLGGSGNYQDVDEELCEIFEEIIEAACSGFCKNSRRFRIAGIIMVVLGSISTAIYLIYSLVSLLKLLGKSTRFHFIYYGVWLAPLMYIVAFTLYLGISNVYGVCDTWDIDTDIETQEGLVLSYFIILVSTVPAIHFNMLWKKEYQKFKSST